MPGGYRKCHTGKLFFDMPFGNMSKELFLQVLAAGTFMNVQFQCFILQIFTIK